MRRTARFADAAARVWSSTITLHLRSTATHRQPAVARQWLLDADVLLDQPDGHAIHDGRVRAPVTLDPAVRHLYSLACTPALPGHGPSGP
jgi:hypothetical protein